MIKRVSRIISFHIIYVCILSLSTSLSNIISIIYILLIAYRYYNKSIVQRDNYDNFQAIFIFI